MMTGLVLALVTQAGADAAEEVVYRSFKRQADARLIPGLKKLGLDQLPPAVACAQYHYLSNLVGGVKVEYVRSWLPKDELPGKTTGTVAFSYTIP